MCRVIAVSNQKGGVGKTVSCVNLGIGLAQSGKKVLLIDADPQGSMTISLGYPEPDDMEYSLASMMMNIVNDEPLNMDKTILHHKEGVDLIPANIELSAIEVSLVNVMSRELILRTLVEQFRKFYDFIIIDCMPSLGMMTINALACADSVLIPVQAAYLPVKGLQQLIKTISRVKKQLNPKLKIEGILLTMVDNRTNYARDEQLKADALENAPEIRPAVIQGMSEVMKEMMGPEAFEMFGLPEEQEEMMYVATVPDKNSGAGVLAYQDFMDQAAEKLGGDFYILPSSIHEILLVPDNGDKAADDLRDMVREVNATQVRPEEKLTDNVYHYDSREHIFELAEKFEARQQEKAEPQIDEKSEEHGSVLKDLKDKQKEVAANNNTEYSDTYPILSGDEERMGYEAYLREQLEISVLKSRYPYDSDMIEGILELMLDILCSRRKMIRIAGDDKPANVVKGRFMKLNMGHIEYVMDCVRENTTKVRSIKQYLLAALYNAPAGRHRLWCSAQAGSVSEREKRKKVPA